MNIHFFFEGKLAREEACSALLATLFEQRIDFRAFFLELCSLPKCKQEASFQWGVTTEKQAFDLLMESDSSEWVILVENKIKIGSVTNKQLIRYYRKLCGISDKKILIVYLTPRPGTGQEEFRRLIEHGNTRAKDCFVHLSWFDIFDYESQIPYSDADLSFIQSGFTATRNHIERALQETYPLVGGRERINAIACGVCIDLCREFPHVTFSKWRGPETTTVMTTKCDISVGFKAITAYDKETNMPLGLLNEDGSLNVTLEVNMSISGYGRKKQVVLNRWQEMSKGGFIEIPGLGSMTTIGNDEKLYFWNKKITATDNEICRELFESGRAVMMRLKDFFTMNHAEEET